VRRQFGHCADYGADPDIWFENVEVIAGRESGKETTTYVRNILKYYVTYQLTMGPGRPPERRRASGAR
jgi:hypothetical protein